MRIGLDFGTTYSKISCLDEQGHPRLFRYPGPAGREYIPTAMAYKMAVSNQRRRYAGEAARIAALNEERVDFYEHFKMLLPICDASEWHGWGWSSGRTPAEVAEDYFREILLEGADSFAAQERDIDSVVVSVPELWQRTVANRGAEKLREILVEKLGLKLDCLQSEPVCAAAYFAYRYQQAERHPLNGNMLVCDMGGGTFDVALCEVRNSTITVLDFDGNGQHGLAEAGVAFDREAVALAFEAKHGQRPDLDSIEFLKLLRTFETLKIEQHAEAERLFELAREDEDFRDTPIYTIDRLYRLNYLQATSAFEHICQGIHAMLDRLLSRSGGRAIDLVAIVGGFGQFPPVRNAVLEKLGVGDNDVRFDAQISGSRMRHFAIACGACLIANNVIQTVEYYPHAVSICGHLRVAGRLEERLFPIVLPGKLQAGQSAPVFLHDANGELRPMRVEQRVYRRLPVYIRMSGEGEWLEIQTPEVEYPPVGSYFVGVQVDRSNLGRLVFRPVSAGRDIIYNLGKLDFVLTAKE